MPVKHGFEPISLERAELLSAKQPPCKSLRSAGLIAELGADCLPFGYFPMKTPSTLHHKYMYCYIILC